MRRVLTAVIAFFIVVLPSRAFADDEVTLPINTVVRAAPGSIIELGQMPIRTSLVGGSSCTWTAVVKNQHSVHPGNDVLIRSGQSELTLAGVEDTADKVTSSTGSVYLVDVVVVLLRMGPDGVFSGGMDLTVQYGCAASTTTAAAATTTTEVATTTTTTTAATTTTSIAVSPASALPHEGTGGILPATGSRALVPLVVATAIMLSFGILMLSLTRTTSVAPTPTDSLD